MGFFIGQKKTAGFMTSQIKRQPQGKQWQWLQQLPQLLLVSAKDHSISAAGPNYAEFPPPEIPSFSGSPPQKLDKSATWPTSRQQALFFTPVHYILY